MKRRTKLLLIALLFALAVPAGVYAANVTGALYTIDVRVQNTGAPRTNLGIPFNVGTSDLIDAGFMQSDALNTAVRLGSTDVAGMPGSNRLALLGAISSSTGSRTDETTAANNQTANDVTIGGLTVLGFYVGMHTPGRILTINIGQAGVGVWDYVWEYYDTASSTYRALSNVVDNTNAFRVAGTSTVSFDMPPNFGTTTEESIVAYWVRARRDSLSSQTVAPLGTRLYYETGQWWTFADSLETDALRTYTLHMGGATNMVSYHQMFVGAQGITTTDAAGLEPGGERWQIEIRGFIDTAATSSPRRSLVVKTGAIDIYVSAANQITASVSSDSTTTDLVLNNVTPGEHTVSLTHDISTNELQLDLDNGTSTVTTTALVVANTTNAWEWATNGSMVYVDWLKLRRRATSTTIIQPSEAASQDAYVRQSAPDTNFNTADLYTGVLTAGGGDEYNSFLQFDLSSVSSSETVVQTDLDLYVEAAGGPPPHTTTARRIIAAWSETGVTWNNRPDTTAQSEVTLEDVNGGEHRAWNITDIAGGWFDSIYANHGVRLHGSVQLNNSIRYSSSGETLQPTQRPALYVYSFNSSTILAADASNVLWYQLTSTPALTVFDRSGNGNTGNFTWTAQPTTTTVTTLPLESTRDPHLLVIGPRAPSIASAAAPPPNLFGSDTGSFLPGYSLINDVFSNAGNQGLPVRLFWVLFFTTIIISMGFVATAATKSLGLGVVVMGILLAGVTQMGTGIIPLWTLFVYVPIALLVMKMRGALAT